MVYIEHNKPLLNRYLYLIKDLATHFGIWLEGNNEPAPPVDIFLKKYQIRGKHKTWDQVPLSKMGYILGDTFGGSYLAISRQMSTKNIKTEGKTLVDVISEKSTTFTDQGWINSVDDYRKFFKDVVKNKALEEWLDQPWTTKTFQTFHGLMAKEIEKPGTGAYKLGLTENLKRGKCLKRLCETHGGLYFVGSSHIDLKGCRNYHFV
jgi:hypothetical protein